DARTSEAALANQHTDMPGIRSRPASNRGDQIASARFEQGLSGARRIGLCHKCQINAFACGNVADCKSREARFGRHEQREAFQLDEQNLLASEEWVVRWADEVGVELAYGLIA